MQQLRRVEARRTSLAGGALDTFAQLLLDLLAAGEQPLALLLLLGADHLDPLGLAPGGDFVQNLLLGLVGGRLARLALLAGLLLALRLQLFGGKLHAIGRQRIGHQRVDSQRVGTRRCDERIGGRGFVPGGRRIGSSLRSGRHLGSRRSGGRIAEGAELLLDLCSGALAARAAPAGSRREGIGGLRTAFDRTLTGRTHRVGRSGSLLQRGERIEARPLGGGSRVGRILRKGAGEEVDGVAAHEERVALREVVVDQRGAPRQKGVARLLPVFAVVAEGEVLVLRIVELDVVPQDGVAMRTVVVDAVAPDLLLLGEDVAVARDGIERVGLLVAAPVGVEVVPLAVPDVGSVEEVGVVGGHVVDHRVAAQLVLVVAHLDPVDADQLLRVGVVVAALGLELILAVDEHAAAVEFAHVVERVEEEAVGIERRVAVDHFDDVRKDLRLVHLAVVEGAVAVDVGRVLVDEDVAEELDAHVRIAHGAVAGDDRAVVLRGEVAHQEDDRVARRDGTRDVGLEVDDFHLALRGGLRRSAPLCEEESHDGDRRCYGEKRAHGREAILPSVCSRRPRRGTRGRCRRTCRRFSWSATRGRPSPAWP